MLKELGLDTFFSVHPKYADIFSRLTSDSADADTREQACEDFKTLLEQNRVEALMSALAWTGDCSGMDCNSFIFAIYDEWFEPLTPKVIWKIHIATNYLDRSPDDLEFAPLSRCMNEINIKGDTDYIDQLKTATPSGAEEHFDIIVSKVQ
jgi:hypothetical protein